MTSLNISKGSIENANSKESANGVGGAVGTFAEGGFECKQECERASGPAGVRNTILVSLLSQGLRRCGGRSDAGGAPHNRP